MSHINLLCEEAKQSHLIAETSRNLQLKGLVARQNTDIKHEIKSMCDNNHGETIKDIEKEVTYLRKGNLRIQINCFQIFVTKI